jgi:hypothetical protein
MTNYYKSTVLSGLDTSLFNGGTNPVTTPNKQVEAITCVTVFAGRTPIRTYRRTVLMGQIPRHAAEAARYCFYLLAVIANVRVISEIDYTETTT